MIQLEENEKILLEVRKHPFIIVWTAVALAFALVLPFVFLFFVGAVASVSPEVVRDATPLALFLYSIWLLGIWVFFFLEWTDFFLDVWYVTDRRIIDVEQKGLFHREVISLRYDNIQDITVETRGFVQTMLRFGDIHVQTAGANREIVLKSAARPEEAREEVLRLQHAAAEAPQAVKVVG